ncbi:MAG TPA: vitamin K epoxide reductase family protein [Thermoplasmata archaeon]|nr:vitamin K epoxide reductase family protein [Thermoplasmata archaeon]
MVEVPVLRRLLVVCILAGLALSGYAALETMVPGLQGSCTVNAFISCEAVAQSAYSHIGPLPVWSLGFGGFVLLFALDVLYMRRADPAFLRWIWILTGLGLAASVILLGVELVLIGALCLVCLGAYLADLAAFAVAWRLLRLGREEPAPPVAT